MHLCEPLSYFCAFRVAGGDYWHLLDLAGLAIPPSNLCSAARARPASGPSTRQARSGKPEFLCYLVPTEIHPLAPLRKPAPAGRPEGITFPGQRPGDQSDKPRACNNGRRDEKICSHVTVRLSSPFTAPRSFAASCQKFPQFVQENSDATFFRTVLA